MKLLVGITDALNRHGSLVDQESLTRDLKRLPCAISLFVTMIDKAAPGVLPRHSTFRGYLGRAISEHPPGAVTLPVPFHNEQSPASSAHASCQASAKQSYISNFRLTSIDIILGGSHMAAVTNVDSIVEFAVYLQQSLLDENEGVNDLTAYLNALPLSHNNLSSSDRVKLNKQGVVLWNICGRLRNTEQLLSRNELLCQSIV
jgi:hypothetical protein